MKNPTKSDGGMGRERTRPIPTSPPQPWGLWATCPKKYSSLPVCPSSVHQRLVEKRHTGVGNWLVGGDGRRQASIGVGQALGGKTGKIVSPRIAEMGAAGRGGSPLFIFPPSIFAWVEAGRQAMDLKNGGLFTFYDGKNERKIIKLDLVFND